MINEKEHRDAEGGSRDVFMASLRKYDHFLRKSDDSSAIVTSPGFSVTTPVRSVNTPVKTMETSGFNDLLQTDNIFN